MSFPERLKKARIEKNLTQEQLADLIGVAKSTLNGYEKGNREPDFFKIKKLIEVLEVDANYLLGIDEPNKKVPSENSGGNDEQRKALVNNYDSLNQAGKNKLVEYSNDLKGNPTYTSKPTAAQPNAGENNSIAADEAATVRAANNAFIAVHTKQK